MPMNDTLPDQVICVGLSYNRIALDIRLSTSSIGGLNRQSGGCHGHLGPCFDNQVASKMCCASDAGVLILPETLRHLECESISSSSWPA
eukprot:1146487-Pelagomonas_calceolata.AAC.7